VVNDSERRGEIRQPVTLVVEYAGRDDLVSDFTENLSMGGTFVQTERELPVGEDVRLLLSCPGLIEPISLDGTVRWGRKRSSAFEPGAGIQFTGYDEKTRRRLREVIDAIAAADPNYVGEVLNLLLVEDNHHVVNLIRDGLTLGRESLGDGIALRFTVASDGQAGLEAALNSTTRFDAALIDIYLPVLDGAALIERLRANTKTQYLPIISLSAGGRDAADKALAAGADRFLSKPVRLREVIDALRGVIPRINESE